MATNTNTARLPAGTGEARRFSDNVITLHARMERCWEELVFHRGYGRHRNARETSDVRTHAEWKADFVECARLLADKVVEGVLEPAPKADE